MNEYKREFYLKNRIKTNNILMAIVLAVIIVYTFYYYYQVNYVLPNQPEKIFDMSGVGEDMAMYGVLVTAAICIFILLIIRIWTYSNYYRMKSDSYDKYVENNKEKYEEYVNVKKQV